MGTSAMLSTVKTVIEMFSTLTALSLTSYKIPTSVDIQNNTVFDNIIVGSGTAGSIVANRLSEDPSVSVLLIEAGTDPQWEAQYAGLFPYLVDTDMDWQFKAQDDGITNQNHRDANLPLPSGKVVGGSSELHHFYRVLCDPYDMTLFAQASGSDAWSFENILPYVKKSERLEDPYLLNSKYAQFHGLDGLLGVTRENRNDTLKLLEAFGDVGHSIKDDVNTNDSMGFTRPLFTISKEGIRQDGAECFVQTAKDRPNYNLLKKTRVTRVLFDDDLNAIGVECLLSDGRYINVYARNEVTLSAGTFMTPDILLRSGIGPKEDLEKLNIPVLYDSPRVGKDMLDHVAVLTAIKLGESNKIVGAADPHLFPLPTIVGSGAANKTQGHSDYVTLNLLADNYPDALIQLCAIVFSINSTVCDKLAEAATGYEVMFTVFNLARPTSTGSITLQSADPNDVPKIYMGHLSDPSDKEQIITNLLDFLNVLNSTYFKSVNAELIDFEFESCKGYEKYSREYLSAYIMEMMGTTFHYSSSCRMGTVVDAELKVVGTKKLRIADASVMPNQVTANINTIVMAIGEKCADMIKAANIAKGTQGTTRKRSPGVLSLVKSIPDMLFKG